MKRWIIISSILITAFFLLSCNKKDNQDVVSDADVFAPTYSAGTDEAGNQDLTDNEAQAASGTITPSGSGEEAAAQASDNASGNTPTEGPGETASITGTPQNGENDTAIDSQPGEINEDKILKNTNYVPGFMILKDFSSWVTFENWGEVYFLAASGEGDFGLTSLYLYLTDKDSNILFEFPYFYGNGMLFYDLKSVDFRDMNGDGLKDVTVIADYMTGIGPDGAKEFPVAGVYFQKDKSFVNLPELDDEINSSGQNENADMVAEYLKNKDINLN